MKLDFFFLQEHMGGLTLIYTSFFPRVNFFKTFIAYLLSNHDILPIFFRREVKWNGEPDRLGWVGFRIRVLRQCKAGQYKRYRKNPDFGDRGGGREKPSNFLDLCGIEVATGPGSRRGRGRGGGFALFLHFSFFFFTALPSSPSLPLCKISTPQTPPTFPPPPPPFKTPQTPSIVQFAQVFPSEISMVPSRNPQPTSRFVGLPPQPIKNRLTTSKIRKSPGK